MPNPQEIYKTYNEKKTALNEKIAVKKQEIESLMADVEALPSELAGQSEEYINRQKEKLVKKIERKTKKMQDWVEEQTKKVEDWLNTQMEQVQQGVNKMLDLQKQVTEEAGKLQAAMAVAILTGQKVEITEQEQEEQETPSIPVPKPKFDDDEYRYAYKNTRGDIISGLGSEVAKRKKYDQSKVYEDDDETLKKSNIYRQKYKWKYGWSHTVEEWKEINGFDQLIPTKEETGFSSTDKDIESLDEVFQSIDDRWNQYKSDAEQIFKKSIKKTTYKKTDSTRFDFNSSREKWTLEISRFA